MEDQSILGGISEIGGAAVDLVENVAEAQVDAISAVGDSFAEAADAVVAGAAYATADYDTAREYDEAANRWSDRAADNMDAAGDRMSDAGAAVWGSDTPSVRPEDVGTGDWSLPDTGTPDIPAPPGGDWMTSGGSAAGTVAAAGEWVEAAVAGAGAGVAAAGEWMESAGSGAGIGAAAGGLFDSAGDTVGAAANPEWSESAGSAASSDWDLPKPEDVGTGNW